MQRICLIIPIFGAAILHSNSLSAQTDNHSVSSINTYIKHIDSLAEHDRKQEFVIRAIAEGPASQEIVTTSPSKRKNGIDTIRKKISGGWGKYTIQNPIGDSVYRIHYHDNLQKNYYLTFYYKNNQLVYSKLDYQENGIGQTFYMREEYYKNDSILHRIETKEEIVDPYKKRAGINLYSKGNEYFREFLKENQNR